MHAGPALCLASAAAFGAMGIFGKLAYEEGATVGTLLAVRFAIASALFWALFAVTGGLRDLQRLPRRDVLIALALGAVGYSLQAGAFFAALDRMDAGLLALLLYTYPALVTLGAVALGRERLDRRRLGALAVASAGLVLVVAGAGTGALDGLGVVLGVAAALVYTTYILSSQGVAGRMGPLALSTLVCTGATATLWPSTFALGQLDPGAVTGEGYVWLASIAVVSTVAGIALFFAGLDRVGPSTASILSTLEPVTAVLLAFLVFGETLGPPQLVGGALVLAAAVALTAGPRSPVAARAAARARRRAPRPAQRPAAP